METVSLDLYPFLRRHDATEDPPSRYTYEISARVAADGRFLDADDRILIDLRKQALESFGQTQTGYAGPPDEGKLLRRWSKAVKTAATNFLAEELSGDALSAFKNNNDFLAQLRAELAAQHAEPPETSTSMRVESFRLATLHEQQTYLWPERSSTVLFTGSAGAESSAASQTAPMQGAQVVDPVHAFMTE